MEVTASSLVFTLLICILFYILRTRFRIAILAAASLVYVFLLDRNAGMAALFMTAFAYVYGLVIAFLAEHGRKRGTSAAAGIGIAAVAALLLLFKETAMVVTAAGRSDSALASLVIPVGFSFYSFQIISYFADIAAGRTRGDRNPWRFALYLLWFPKFISGPIVRKESFNQEIRKIALNRLFDVDRWKEVLAYTVTGFFLKAVVADRLAIYVDTVWGSLDTAGGVWLFLGAVLYSVQIYCDFAGYSYVAMGLSRLFGIELPENFSAPYMSPNITEFWRRWHISLSGWLRDYIYIPLGGNRKGDGRKMLNTLAVFLICGAWHGAGLSFVIWGLLHGLYSVLDFAAAKKGWTKIRSGLPGRILTFAAVTFAWIFFRAETTALAGSYIAGIFTRSWGAEALRAGWELLSLSQADVWVFVLMIAAVFLMDLYSYRNRTSLPECLTRRPRLTRYGMTIVMILIIIVFGIYGPGHENHMIYMQF